MKINGIKIHQKKFAYDGCHKIYLLENEEEEKEALKYKFEIYNVEELEEKFNQSCPLRMISTWDLEKGIVKQFEKAIFEK